MVRYMMGPVSSGRGQIDVNKQINFRIASPNNLAAEGFHPADPDYSEISHMANLMLEGKIPRLRILSIDHICIRKDRRYRGIGRKYITDLCNEFENSIAMVVLDTKTEDCCGAITSMSVQRGGLSDMLWIKPDMVAPETMTTMSQFFTKCGFECIDHKWVDASTYREVFLYRTEQSLPIIEYYKESGVHHV